MNIITSLDTLKFPTAIALGNFDGIHRGHNGVIQPILSTNDGISTVVSFQPHPREWFSGQRLLLLTPLEEKAEYLSQIGVQQLVVLPFDQSLSTLSPQAFVENILIQQLNARQISVGQNFKFGYRRSGTTADLKAIAASHNIYVHIADVQDCENERISSSAIRKALKNGDIERANRFLGRAYRLRGWVMSGQKIGRTIGFPTANLKLPDDKFCPRHGVYQVLVQCKGESSMTQPIRGVMNIGNRPTVDGTHVTIEVHLLDWSGDLYGKELSVQLVKFLRPEQKFDSLDALKDQIKADCDVARQ